MSRLLAVHMHRLRVLAVFVLLGPPSAHAFEQNASDIYGSWCFVEQSGHGRSMEEKVDIRFAPDGRYTWTESGLRTEGRWRLGSGVLEMTKWGRLEVQGRPGAQWQLRMSGSTIRLVRGACPATGFSAQDQLEFHNATLSGNLATVQSFLNRGLHPDIRDRTRGDTGLIKAAKGCQTAVAHALLERGAQPGAVNDEGRKALDYAWKSDFHRGCPTLVDLLRSQP